MPSEKVVAMPGMLNFSPVQGVAAILELTASEQPELLGLQIHILVNSPMRFAVDQLAAHFGVASSEMGATVFQACHDLEKLERRGSRWRDPGEVVEHPNLAALCEMCRARSCRVMGLTRRRRLEAVLRRLRGALELARSRAWIEAFIGPPRAGTQEPGPAD